MVNEILVKYTHWIILNFANVVKNYGVLKILRHYFLCFYNALSDFENVISSSSAVEIINFK